MVSSFRGKDGLQVSSVQGTGGGSWQPLEVWGFAIWFLGGWGGHCLCSKDATGWVPSGPLCKWRSRVGSLFSLGPSRAPLPGQKSLQGGVPWLGGARGWIVPLGRVPSCAPCTPGWMRCRPLSSTGWCGGLGAEFRQGHARFRRWRLTWELCSEIRGKCARCPELCRATGGPHGQVGSWVWWAGTLWRLCSWAGLEAGLLRQQAGSWFWRPFPVWSGTWLGDWAGPKAGFPIWARPQAAFCSLAGARSWSRG